MKTLIIDGDIVLFQIGRVTEDITDFGDMVCESFDMESSVRLLEHELDMIAKRTGYARENMMFAISSDTNFRKTFFPTYKGNRKNVRKPLGLKAMREFLLDNMEKYQTIMMNDLEADDVMWILGSDSPDDYTIYSQDKDLYTIPCEQWDFKKKKFITPKLEQSLHFLYTQVLTGDTVDGYKGCPKIGKVKAQRALCDTKSELDMLKACHLLYINEYGKEAKEKLLIQIGQARILHMADLIQLRGKELTYNPYELLGVDDEMLQMWSEEAERNVKPKRVRTKKAEPKAD